MRVSSNQIKSSSNRHHHHHKERVLFTISLFHTVFCWWITIRMSIMDILDPFTMKNVIIYEKGWKVCLKWDISCSIWMQGRIVWARNRQKWQLGEYEGERGSCNVIEEEEEERSNSFWVGSLERKGGGGGWKERFDSIRFDSMQFLQRPNHFIQPHRKTTLHNPSLHHDHPLNLSILLSGGKENNHDGESNSEWKHQEWVQHENLTIQRWWEL